MSKDYYFNQQTFIEQPLDTVFAFFSKAKNLEKVTPPKLRFKILTPLPINMHRGTLIDYQIRLLAVPFKWQTKITLWEPPFRFQDVQLKGPYKKWKHTHLFEAVDGGTQMTDEVVYQIPFAPLSPILHTMFIKGQIESIFAYRKEQLDTLFGNVNGG